MSGVGGGPERLERGGHVSVDTRQAGSAGTVGDRYRLLECVAGDPGGPAVAWRAWDDVLNRPVTLTVVRPGGPATRQMEPHAAFRQPKHSFDFPLTGGNRRVAPEIELAASRELFLRGLPRHGRAVYLRPSASITG